MGIKYKTGASGLGGSLGGLPGDALSEGFDDVTPAQPEPWDRMEDDSGTNQVGDRWAFKNTGACGRPNGNER